METVKNLYIRRELVHNIVNQQEINSCYLFLTQFSYFRISKVILERVTDIEEIKRALADYVEKEIFQDAPQHERPQRTNRKFYPRGIDIRNHMFQVVLSQRYCKDDQESLRRKVEEWQASSSGSKFFYCTCQSKDGDTDPGKSEDEDTFLFVHREP